MKKLNKRRIRKIILEETINAVSLVQEAMKQPNLAMFGKGDLDKTRDMYVSTPRGPNRIILFIQVTITQLANLLVMIMTHLMRILLN